MTSVTQPTTAAAEIAAMRRITAAPEWLDPAAQDRVIGWLFDRYRSREIVEAETVDE